MYKNSANFYDNIDKDLIYIKSSFVAKDIDEVMKNFGKLLAKGRTFILHFVMKYKKSPSYMSELINIENDFRYISAAPFPPKEKLKDVINSFIKLRNDLVTEDTDVKLILL